MICYLLNRLPFLTESGPCSWEWPWSWGLCSWVIFHLCSHSSLFLTVFLVQSSCCNEVLSHPLMSNHPSHFPLFCFLLIQVSLHLLSILLGYPHKDEGCFLVCSLLNPYYQACSRPQEICLINERWLHVCMCARSPWWNILFNFNTILKTGLYFIRMFLTGSDKSLANTLAL